jgi:hypothetical protein
VLGDLTAISPGMNLVGRGSGARQGPWRLSVVESADIEDDRLATPSDALRTVDVLQSAWTERQLLKPFDILVTARSRRVKVALVPADAARTVASATLLVVRVPDPSAGLAHFLWYYLTSARGRALVEGQITQGVTIPTLSAGALASIPVPIPGATVLRAFPRLVEATLTAHAAALTAARIRRDIVREAIVGDIAIGHTREVT